MKPSNHTIEIDAQEAFAKLGVDLRISPIAEQCVDSLRKHLIGGITLELVVNALGDAARPGKSRRIRKQAEELQNGGTVQ